MNIALVCFFGLLGSIGCAGQGSSAERAPDFGAPDIAVESDLETSDAPIWQDPEGGGSGGGGGGGGGYASRTCWKYEHEGTFMECCTYYDSSGPLYEICLKASP
jgi:hypothetical protein